MDFVPNTKKQREEMLEEIGVGSIEELFKDIPNEILLKEKLKIGESLSEQELKRQITALSKKNATPSQYSYFLGAGIYSHFIPAIVGHLVGRSEFYTSYTPYQAEVSQGVLQAIYEWQTFISILTGADLANASMYDGASASAEAILMAGNITKRNSILVAKSLNPEYRKVVATYANANELELNEIGFENGLISLKELKEKLDGGVAAILVQNPNFFGCIENLKEIAELAHSKNALLVVAITEPISLGLLKSPGEEGADIVVGEGQSFGIPMSFGGPGVGFMATKKEYIRKIPGRLSGKTVDKDGRAGYILTLQAREQHIRREKASSNICSNQALCALAATIYLASVGKNGLRQVAELNLQKANYAAEKISEIGGFELPFKAPIFNEFVVKTPNAKIVQEELLKEKIIAGYRLGNKFPELKDCLLFAVTEVNSKEEIDKLVEKLKGMK